MSKGGRLGAFDRLSSREKALVVGLLLAASAIAAVITVWWIASTMDSLEEEIALNREAMDEVESAAVRFQEVKVRCDALQQIVEQNPISSLRIPVNNIARNVQLEGGKKLSDEIGSLEKQVETQVGFACDRKAKAKKKKKGRKGVVEPEEGNVKVEQEFEFRSIPLAALFDLLEGIEQSPDLLFVTRLEIARRFGNEDMANTAQITVTTYRSQGGP